MRSATLERRAVPAALLAADALRWTLTCSRASRASRVSNWLMGVRMGYMVAWGVEGVLSLVTAAAGQERGARAMLPVTTTLYSPVARFAWPLVAAVRSRLRSGRFRP